MSEEKPRKRVTIRLGENLLAEIDERTDNRSEYVREAVREKVNREPTTEIMKGPVEPSLNDGWHKLRELSNDDNVINEDEALSHLAQHHSITQPTVRRRIIHPLRSRGYIIRRTDELGRHAALKIRE